MAQVWVPHDSNVFELAVVVEDNEELNQVTVELSSDNAIRKFSKTSTHSVDPTHMIDLDDLCDMNNLHEAPLLDIIRRRLASDKIYTYTGNFLVSLNPYKHIPLLYDSPMRFYDMEPATKVEDGLIVYSKKSAPHVYAIANNALRAMDETLDEQTGVTMANETEAISHNQSIIITGESGAGKTEASKHVMTFLTEANNHNTHTMTGKGDRIKSIILESSLIFESFGNSKTVRNDNSSRFGKYIKLQYSHSNQLLSAFTETFLLEKSRLVSVGKGERNYHIFYQLIRGLAASDSATASRLRLSSVDSFQILTEGGCTVVGKEEGDVEDFNVLLAALRSLGCSEEEIDRLFELLAVVLHLGNIRCIAGGDENTPAELETAEGGLSIDEIASTLGVESTNLVNSITMQRMQAARRASMHVKILSASDAKNNISALIKWLYKNIFAWIVRKVNYVHGTVSSEDAGEVVKFIGILDIFGFEILGTNSFEQLCINYTNERLQQQFNQHVFVLEQQEYAREGLDWKSISYRDNQHVIDLISKKPQGLLMILEEHGMMNRKPDDLALVNAFNQAHDKVQPAYVKSRFGNDRFVVKHFAGDVTYSIEGFLSKNNDSLQDDLVEQIMQSNNVFLVNLLAQENPNAAQPTEGPGFIPKLASQAPVQAEEEPVSKRLSTGNKKMASTITVSFYFRNQLDLLVNTLRATQPHYIKCVKPNGQKAADTFTAALVMEQLRYSGVLEVVRIRREGFPSKMPFVEFYSQYAILAFGKDWLPPDQCSEVQGKEYAMILATTHLERSGYQIGNNFIFLGHDGPARMLHAINMFFVNKAIIIQSRFRRNKAVTSYATARKRVLLVSSICRMFIARSSFLRIRRQVVGIQKCYRIVLFKRVLADKNRRRIIKQRNDAATKLQSQVRVRRCRNQARALRATMTTIQLFVSKILRKNKARKRFLLVVSKSVLLEAIVRRFLAIRRYRRTQRLLIRIQSFVRKVAALKKYLRSRRSLIRLQSQIRKRQAVLRFSRARRAAVCLQVVFRRFVAEKNYKAMKSGVLCLQSKLRMRFIRARFLRAMKGLRKLQRAIRSYIYAKGAEAKAAAATAIQARVRQRLSRRRYLATRSVVIKLQSFGRMIPRKNDFQSVRQSVILAQTIARRLLAMRRLQRALAAAIRLQALVRGNAARFDFQIQYNATIKLQSFGRMLNQWRWYETVVFSAILLQTAIRRYTARSQFLLQRYAVTKIQSVARSRQAVVNLQISRQAAIVLQSFCRMVVEMIRYDGVLFSLLLLQNAIRKFVAERRYARVKYSVLVLQTAARRMICRNHYLLQQYSAIKLQAFGRMVSARFDFDNALFSAVMVQTAVRRHLAQLMWQKQKESVVIVQSFCRMFLCRIKFVLAILSAIKIQSLYRSIRANREYFLQYGCAILLHKMARGFVARRAYAKMKFVAIRLQSLARMRACRGYFLMEVGASLQLSVAIRRFLATRQVARLRQAVRRIYVGIRRYALNWKLRQRISKLHHCCRAGDVSTLKSHLARNPLDAKIRYDSRDLFLLHHAAVAGGQVSSLKALNVSLKDLFLKAAHGNNLLHTLAQHPSMAVLQLFVSFVNTVNTKVEYDVKEEDDGDEDDHVDEHAATGGDGSVARLTDAVSGLPILMTGWMRKKRNSSMLGFKKWNRRWCVLTEETLTYYKTDAPNSRPCGFLPLEGCIIDRPAGKECIITVVSPQTVFKKGMFGDKAVGPLILAVETEMDLQGWLNPLKGAAGVSPFRSTAITHRNNELRATWVNKVNNDHNNALHLMALASRQWALDLMEGVEVGLGIPTENLTAKQTEALNTIREALQLAGWLLFSGCHIDHENAAGKTPLQLAVEANCAPLIMFLKRRGADVHRLGSEEAKVIATATKVVYRGDMEPEDLLELSHAQAIVPPIHPPIKLKGYSFVQLWFRKLHCERQSLSTVENPILSVALYNPKLELVESVQDFICPAYVDSSAVCWSCAWNMQTPIENCEDGCFIVIRYGGMASAEMMRRRDTNWAFISLNKATIDSSEVSVDMLPGHADLELASKGEKKKAAASGSTGMSLDVEILLSKRFRQADIEQFI